jgi:MFS transporter, DHA1 family, inner membrane transport protein
MAFFNNSNINRTYVHAGLQTFAENVGGVFVFVSLLKGGLSVPTVFAVLAAIFILRIVMRFAVVPVVKRIGLRNGLILGTFMVALAYLLLTQVQGVGPLLIFFIFFDALSTSFYWTCHHAYVSKIGDAEHRGSQVSVREALNAIMGIVAPLLGSFLLVYVGKGSAFVVAACVEALAILPLLGAPNFRIAEQAAIDPGAQKFAALLFFTDGVVTASFFFTWIIALFQTLGQNFGAYGGTLALAGLFGAGVSLLMGRMIDRGHNRRSAQIAYAVMALSIILKCFAFAAPLSAVAATAFGAVAAPLYMPVLMARIYNMSKASACPLRFQVITESGWDLGTGLGCIAAALLTWAGVGFFWPLIIGLAGCAAGYRLVSQSPALDVISTKTGMTA